MGQCRGTCFELGQQLLLLLLLLLQSTLVVAAVVAVVVAAVAVGVVAAVAVSEFQWFRSCLLRRALNSFGYFEGH